MLNSPLQSFFYELKNQFLVDDEFIAHYLEISPEEFTKKNLTNQFSFNDILKACDVFQININDIQDRKINYKRLKQKFYSPVFAIPDEFKLNAGTYMSNIRSILNVVQRKYNLSTAEYILNTCDISRNALLNDDLKVNVSLTSHIFQSLQSLGKCSENDFLAMAINSYDGRKRKDLLAGNLKYLSDFELVDFVVQNSHQYELNFNYKTFIHSENIFYIQAESKENMNDFLSQARISCSQGIEFRKASIQALSLLSGRGKLQIVHTEDEIKNQKQMFKIFFKETKKPLQLSFHH